MRHTSMLLGSLAVVFFAGVLHAEGQALKLSPGTLPRPASPPLQPLKKLEAVNKVAKVLGLPALAAVPPAQMKLTPIAPVHEGGAKITYAAPVNFLGPQPAFPEGAYMLDYGPGTKNELRMDLPTENGKLYLLDCRLAQVWGSSPLLVTIKRGDASQTLGAEDGHYLYTFKSDKPLQQVRLSTEHTAAFYGCELSKLN